MKRIAKAAAWLILIALTALGPLWAATVPAEREKLVRKRYESWTGVLRLWKCEGWQSGSGTMDAWLSACIAAFEKSHPGVYVQTTDVSEETLRGFADGSLNPPDMILFAPGMLDAPYSLMAIEEEVPIRETLDGVGVWQGMRYAVPVAMGGYGLVINSQLLPETPADWSAQAIPEKKSGASRSKEVSALLNAPADGSARSWSAALLALFAGSYEDPDEYEPVRVGEGVNLGLETDEPAATVQPDDEARELYPNALPAVLPEDFRSHDSVYSQFTSGRIAAMPVTQREVRRLQLLAETGKAPDWRVECIGLPFTDQVSLFSVVAWPRGDSSQRQALSVEFMNLMLSEEMQAKLTLSRAFAVRSMPAMYRSSQGMGEIEAALGGDDLLVPPAFGSDWREYAASLMNQTGAGGQTQSAFELLRQMMEGA